MPGLSTSDVGVFDLVPERRLNSAQGIGGVYIEAPCLARSSFGHISAEMLSSNPPQRSDGQKIDRNWKDVQGRFSLAVFIPAYVFVNITGQYRGTCTRSNTASWLVSS